MKTITLPSSITTIGTNAFEKCYSLKQIVIPNGVGEIKISGDYIVGSNKSHLTGDLGIYGINIVKEVYKEVTGIKLNNIVDAGSIFYQDDNIYAGASGPVCLALVLFDYILKSDLKINRRKSYE